MMMDLKCKNVQNQFNTVLLTSGKTCDKLEAHVKGLQHYAFSIFVYDSKGLMLLQQRALSKYHSGGLWSNACCSHPLQVDSLSHVEEQAKARLKYEMGLLVDELCFDYIFIYKRECSKLIENEVDYVFHVVIDEIPNINRKEVEAYKWIGDKELKVDIKLHPEKYSIWFKDIMDAKFCVF